MKMTRELLGVLVEGGHLDAGEHHTAAVLAGVAPDAARWHRFLQALCLFLGVLCLTAAVGYFVAYNWQDMGRFAKIGLLELFVVIPMIAAMRYPADTQLCRASLMMAAIAIGPLLAYVGQTYQTGADPYELFVAWAGLMLPLVALSRWRILIIFWSMVANLALSLYFIEAWRPLADVFDRTGNLAHIAFNGVLLVVLEALSARLAGAARSAERFTVAQLAVSAVALYFFFIFDRDRALWHALLPAAVFAALGFQYYRRQRDMVALATWSFGLVVMAVATVGKVLFEAKLDSVAFLLTGCTAIGLSAWAAMWLRGLARQEDA